MPRRSPQRGSPQKRTPQQRSMLHRAPYQHSRRPPVAPVRDTADDDDDEYPWMTYASAHALEPLATALGVSTVARGAGGFMRAYQRHGKALRTRFVSGGGGQTWGRKRRNFIARHMAQYRAHRPTLRRWLALAMWAYRPPGSVPSASPRARALGRVRAR